MSPSGRCTSLTFKRQTTLRDTASLNLTFLGQCRVNHLVPKGLRLRKGCAASPSDDLQKKFKSTLDDASLKLLLSLIDHYEEILASASSQQADHSASMIARLEHASEGTRLSHQHIVSRTMVNIRKKKSNKMKTLKKKFELLWKESQRPGPHPPLVFTPTQSPTHMKTSASSSD